MHPNGAIWESVDWRKSDAAIAAEINRSQQRVHQQRKKLGKPRSILHGCRPKLVAMLRQSRALTIDQVISREPPYMRYYYRAALRRLIARGAHKLIS